MTSTPQFFRILADRTRLRILNLLAQGPLCVCDIQHVLQQPQSSVSRHLAQLRVADLVRDRRDGMRTFYELTQWQGGLAGGVLDTLRRELGADPEFAPDLKALDALKAGEHYHRGGNGISVLARVRNPKGPRSLPLPGPAAGSPKPRPRHQPAVGLPR